jgi:hypothetical protein
VRPGEELPIRCDDRDVFTICHAHIDEKLVEGLCAGDRQIVDMVTTLIAAAFKRNAAAFDTISGGVRLLAFAKRRPRTLEVVSPPGRELT